MSSKLLFGRIISCSCFTSSNIPFEWSAIVGSKIAWEKNHRQKGYAYSAIIPPNDQKVFIRVNSDFPEVDLYAFIVEEKVIFTFNNWPKNWCS